MSDETKIVITINEDGISCHSEKLTAPELVYWLEVAKKIVIEDSMEPSPNSTEAA